MPLYNPPTGSIVFQYVNPDIPAGNTITSALIANPKTPFASNGSIPEAAAFIGAEANLEASGIWSTLLNLPLTLTVDFQGVTIATATLPIALISGTITSKKWSLQLTATIQNSGMIEVQGSAQFWTTDTSMVALPIKNTTQFSMSTAGGVPFVVSAQWGALSLGGSITLRQLVVQVTG